MKGLTRRIKNRYLNARRKAIRGRFFVDEVLKGADGFRELVRHMRAGGACCILPDQNAKSHGVVVPFLGKPASTFQGPAALHLLTGAQLVTAVDVRLAEDPRQHVCELGFVPPWPRSGDRDRDVLELTRQLNEMLGTRVLEHPEQYFWVHRRWGKLEESVRATGYPAP